MFNSQNYQNQEAADRSIRRIKSLLQEDLTQTEMVLTLNREGYRTIRGKPWTLQNLRVVLHRLRHEQKSWYGLSQARAKLSTEMLAC